MPSDFINSLRDSTIQEYLHGDRNRSSFLAHQIRQSVDRFEGALEPETYEAVNELEVRNTNATADEIKQKLLDTFNNLNTLYNDTTYNTTKYSKLYNNIGNYTTVLVDYNRLVTLYLTTTNNVSTRQSIYSTLMGTRDIYSKLSNLCLNILNNYNNIPNPGLRETAIRKYFVKVLLLLSLYDIISNQFNGNQFFVIPENYLLTNIETLKDRRPWIRGIINEFNLRVELYGVAPNIPASQPQPPPMGGLPGTGGFPPPRGGPGGGGPGGYGPGGYGPGGGGPGGWWRWTGRWKRRSKR